MTATLLLYKPVVGALRKAKLMPESTGHAAPVEGKKHLGMTIVILFVFITCVLFALSLQESYKPINAAQKPASKDAGFFSYPAVGEVVRAAVHIGLEGDGLAYVLRVAAVGEELVEKLLAPRGRARWGCRICPRSRAVCRSRALRSSALA